METCSRANTCVNKDVHCDSCTLQRGVKERAYFYKEYKPLCPRGYSDCIHDPAYLKHYYPEWYKKTYGNKTPEEVLLVENGCMQRFKEDPNEEEYCYDDEDK